MVSVAWSTAAANGVVLNPTETAGGVFPQPVVTAALHVAPLITETLAAPPGLELGTYTVSVA